ncbi:hypothetical protein PAP_03500 [Palaeococcus pacificus DY20341]|uniref:Uncharacterized protein n=1 Tax=Palaeococcus pacificus DY20341 TaxID=1343739 RepID=A0A075LQY2_9EURY|nr:hypothetical protein [Palaeococcus pacificus]AIF69120.1 hypothetical protein PAP_03500 [Palaeococcus pacificus DY20341]
MDKRVLIVVLIGVLVLAPVGAFSYGYSNYSSQISPIKKPLSSTQVVVPYGGNDYTITLESYITGNPMVDLNITLRSITYERATLLLGDPSFKNCQGEACVWRTRTGLELAATIGALMGRKYYYEAIVKEGKDNQTAKKIAAKEAQARVDTSYIAFLPKAMIGLGRIGNEKHLLVVLIGPKEGGQVNRIYVPKAGIVVLEATDEQTLFVEVLLLKSIINSQVQPVTTQG